MEVWPVTSWLPPFQVFFSRGVLRAHSEFGNAGEGQNTFAPRFGFAWQFLPNTSRFVLRGGYGTYYSRPTGQAFYQNVFGATFSMFRLNAGEANANATFQAPFPRPFPTPESFPSFPAYSPTTIYSGRPRFSARRNSAVFLECSGGAASRLALGNWIRGHSRHTPGTPTFSESSAAGLYE